MKSKNIQNIRLLITILAAILAAITAFINPAFAEEKKENTVTENPKILIAYYSWSGNN